MSTEIKEGDKTMKIYPSEVKRVVDSLPIGFYANFRIPLTVSETEECSYYRPKEKDITISFKQIAYGLETVTDESYMETAIRTMVYHEVSHAILTPRDLKMNDVLNIFEDERIETMLAGYYHDVDFKKNVRLINQWDGSAPKNDMEKFYHVVRFRSGTAEQLQDVEDVINRLRWASAAREGEASYFTSMVYDLYERIVGKPYEEEEEKRESGREGQPSDSESETKEGETMSGVFSDADMKNPLKAEDIKKILDNAVDRIRTKFRGCTLDPKKTEAFAMLFENFKRRTGGGAALQAYSGVMNPRNIVRNDFKFFDRMSENRGTNKFGSVHLNLFIDVSGSFFGNQDEMNKILCSLETLERRYKFFTFDVVACSEGEVKLPKANRYINCAGGNNLDDKIYDLFRELQFSNTYNYNIVLFDGDAYSDYYEDDAGRTFNAFDHSNCTIISDPSNERYIHKNVSRARVTYTRNYVSVLFNNILSALQLALH